jgi:hypothetical protein
VKVKTLHAIFAASRQWRSDRKKPALHHESAGRRQPNVARAQEKVLLWRNVEAIRHE